MFDSRVLPSNELIGWITFKVDKVSPYFQNGYGAIQGGALLTFMDITSGIALSAFESIHTPPMRKNVSLNFLSDFINSGVIG